MFVLPGRISPSDRDSVVSDHSTERESTGENLRATAAAPSDSKQTRKAPINVLNGKWPWQHHSYTKRDRGRGAKKKRTKSDSRWLDLIDKLARMWAAELA